MLAIDPDECIDCALCEPECPVNAILSEDDVPDDQQEFIALNAELSKTWSNINKKKAAPVDADDWKDTPGKRQYLKKKAYFLSSSGKSMVMVG